MITIVLQAGGQSSRMGKDKAFLPFLGFPLIERLVDRFQHLNAEILIISNNTPLYQDFGLPVYGDVRPGRGALGGLLTALSVANTPLIGLVAVDMPFASPKLIRFMADSIQGSNWDGIIPSTSNGIEPLHAVYRRETCLSLVDQAINQDLWRMKAWHKKANLKILDPVETLEVTGSEHTFLNLNTPEEFSAAEEMARDIGLE
jgi:molybdopterin-guanine dinucleotide biosynthesis protein A